MFTVIIILYLLLPEIVAVGMQEFQQVPGKIHLYRPI